jgi:hypothetical protein
LDSNFIEILNTTIRRRRKNRKIAIFITVTGDYCARELRV